MKIRPTPPQLPSPLQASSTPMEVADCAALDLSARRAILERWHEEALALDRAAAEGMDGAGSSRLAEVAKALQRLDEH